MRKIPIFLFLVVGLNSFGQITDDSTDFVYGPKTTLFTSEEDILNNTVSYSILDTSLYLFERRGIVDRKERKLQNLGSFGTALFPVFYGPTSQIGRSSGFNAYKSYFRTGDEIKLYDTKSPLIDLLAYLGGENRNLIDVDFSRNVREGWNVGFDIHTITTDKQLANNGKADRQVVGTSFDIYSHYRHKKAPYQAVFYYSNMSHKVIELGGVRFNSDSLLSDLFQFNNALLRLEDAQNDIKQNTWHLYHDYQVADPFQLYHILDYTDEKNTYQDFEDNSAGDYNTYRDAYDQFLIDDDSTREQSTFSSLSNEAGIKGDLSKVFYRAYVKMRRVDFDRFLLDTTFIDTTALMTETYFGGHVRFNGNGKFKLIGEGEWLQGGGHRLTGTLSSDPIHVSYHTAEYNVPFIYNSYFGNHYEWSNSFTPVLINQIKGDIRLNYKAFSFIPKASLATYNNFIYFGETRMPVQDSLRIMNASVGGEINVGLPNKKGESFHFENEIIATHVSGGSADAMRIPALFYNGRYYWRGLLFGDNVPVETGLDLHARSSYFANAFDPVTQQFYLQNELETQRYFKVDVFFNMRLDKFYFGLKWVHIDEPSDSGYFATPYFPGQPRTIDLMVRWRFYN